MTLLTLYKVWCTGTSTYEQVWATTLPTVSPIDGSGISSDFTTRSSSINIGNAVASITDADSPYTPNTDNSIQCDSSSGNIVVNLPTAAGIEGQIYHFVKTSASNTVTINAYGSETISEQSTITLTFNENQTTMRSDGTDWDNNIGNIDVAEADTSYVSAVENVGSGVGIVHQRVGNVFQIKSLNPSSNKLSITKDNSNKQVNFDITTANLINDVGSGTGDIWSADKIQSSINALPNSDYEASETATASTTSSTYVDLPNTSVTVTNNGTADYFVWFTGECYVSKNNTLGEYIINVDGSDIAHSKRSLNSKYYISASSQCKVTSVPNGAVIKIRYKVSSKTIYFKSRSIYVTEV